MGMATTEYQQQRRGSTVKQHPVELSPRQTSAAGSQGSLIMRAALLRVYSFALILLLRAGRRANVAAPAGKRVRRAKYKVIFRGRGDKQAVIGLTQ